MNGLLNRFVRTLNRYRFFPYLGGSGSFGPTQGIRGRPVGGEQLHIDSMTRRLPPRLRETISLQHGRVRSHRRMFFMSMIAILGLLVLLLGYGLIERNVVRPHVDARVERSDMFVKAGEHIQVNVVNACGANGVAQKFTEFLRARKFDVPEYGTDRELTAFSKVIDRIGDPISARKVAYALGISPERIETDIDSSLYLRATVLIGQDYESLRPMK